MCLALNRVLPSRKKSMGEILLAKTTSLRFLVLANQVPIKRSVSPCFSLAGGEGYISAVSQKLTPSDKAKSICSCASASEFCWPQVIVPRHILETLSPSLGRVVYFITESFLFY